MRSPFPGVDPYLEQFSGDLHHTIIVRARHAVQKLLPEEMIARIDVREFIEPIESWPRDEAERFVRLGGSLEDSEPASQGFIQITDRTLGRRVITVIEILKPSVRFPVLGTTYSSRARRNPACTRQPGRDRPEPNRRPRAIRPLRSRPRRPSHALCRLRQPRLEAAGFRVLSHFAT